MALQMGSASAHRLTGVQAPGSYTGLTVGSSSPSGTLKMGTNTGFQNPYGGNLSPTVNPASIGYDQPGPAAPPNPVYRYSDGSVAASQAAAQASAQAAAEYDDIISRLRGQEGRLNQQQTIGLGNIQNSYNQSENRLNQQRGIAQRNYDTQNNQNVRNYSTTRGGIQSNTRATANALQRLLGINGAGNSSAAYEQAPYAAGLQGSQNLSQAQQVYGNNQSALKTNWDDSEMQFKNYREDLNNQKFSQTNSLKASIAQTRASLLDKLSQAEQGKRMAQGASYETARGATSGIQSQIDGLLNQITGLGNQWAKPVMKTGNVRFNAPALNQFSLGGDRISQGGGAAGSLDPAFVGLLNEDEEEGLY